MIPIRTFDSSRQILTPANVPFAGSAPVASNAAAAEGCREFNLHVAGFRCESGSGKAYAEIVAAIDGTPGSRRRRGHCEPIDCDCLRC